MNDDAPRAAVPAAGQVWRIGILGSATAATTAQRVEAFRAGLREADAGDFAGHAEVKAALAKLKRRAR